MKTSLLLRLSIFFLILAACGRPTHSQGSGKLPPGQVKKITGSQSAKTYAPGQQKKKR